MELLLNIYGLDFKIKLLHIAKLKVYTLLSIKINNFKLIKLTSLANKALVFDLFNMNIVTKWLIKKED